MLARKSAAARWTLSVASCLVVQVVALPALAEDPTPSASSDDLARRHFDSGVAYLEESDLENALKAFEKAYELSKRPAILLNIATVQERRGDLDAAITALQGYLAAEPRGEHAETTRLRLQNLEKRRALSPAVAPVPARATAPEPQPRPAAQASSPPPPPPPAPPPAPKESPSPVASLALFGVAGVATAAAALTGVLANGKYEDLKSSCSPQCTDHNVAPGKTLALASTLATGAAIVSAGVGIVLLFSNDSSERASQSEVRLGVAADGARATARIRF